MRISVHNCPDKNFVPYITAALLYYSGKIFSERLAKFLTIRIVFRTFHDNTVALTSVEKYNKSRKPRGFLIEFGNNLAAGTIFSTLAHELIHIKQYIDGDLAEDQSYWKGEPIDPNEIDYWDYPWELDALGKEVGLYTRFVIEHKLWEVFTGINNPIKPKKSRIRWKKTTDASETA